MTTKPGLDHNQHIALGATLARIQDELNPATERRHMKIRPLAGGADLHPKNKTDPKILCEVWEIDYLPVFGDGSELPPPPADRGSFVLVPDTDGASYYTEGFLEYARAACMIIICSSPGAGFFFHWAIKRAVTHKLPAIVIVTKPKWHRGWVDLITKEAPQAVVYGHDPVRGHRTVNEPATMPPGVFPPPDLVRKYGMEPWLTE